MLTGGAVLLEGMTEFAEEILGMPVRIGFPTGVKGITQLVHGPAVRDRRRPREVRRAARSPSALARAARVAVGAAPPRAAARARRSSQIEAVESCAKRPSFWEWIKAAF